MVHWTVVDGTLDSSRWYIGLVHWTVIDGTLLYSILDG